MAKPKSHPESHLQGSLRNVAFSLSAPVMCVCVVWGGLEELGMNAECKQHNMAAGRHLKFMASHIQRGPQCCWANSSHDHTLFTVLKFPSLHFISFFFLNSSLLNTMLCNF